MSPLVSFMKISHVFLQISLFPKSESQTSQFDHSLHSCNNLDVNGLSEVDENDSQDTLANDDDAHKAVLSALSLILCD